MAVVLGAVAALSGCGGGKAHVAGSTHSVSMPMGKAAAAPAQHTSIRLRARTVGSLPAAGEDAAAAPVGGELVLAGGLTAADTSSSAVLAVHADSVRSLGSLPSALHDAAAATVGGSTYVFGGGNGVAQLDAILRIGSGTATVVGRLPAPSSDQTGIALGGTAYVVGGYTGTRWLDTIVSWRPGVGARVVAHLPHTVRYAAVTAVAGRIVIAGGSLVDGSASSDVFAFDPRTRRVTRIASLPAPTTHAAAAALGSTAYVLGGRSATLDTPVARIVAVEVPSGKVRNGGTLPQPLSDLSVGTVGNRIVVAGGHTHGRTVADVLSLRPVTVRTPAAATPTAAAAPPRALANVYAADKANVIAPAARSAIERIYVPNSQSNTVDVIDPHTYKIVDHFAVGGLPQHVTPAWDLKHLYVLNDTGNSLTQLDPRTGKPSRTIPVDDPYNMYFTPDGRYAIVVAERLHRLDFRNAHTFRLHHSLTVPCSGVDHMDFSADGRYLIASCEFSGELIKVDVASQQVVGTLTLPNGSAGMPQDVKLSPDGRVFYVADMHANGLWKLNGDTFKVEGFLPTGLGVHGLYPSRDARYLYATNRGEGTISVISFATRKVVRTWRIPGGGSPDMGGVSADGKVLWLSGRYSAEVYAISTRDGRLIARIPVQSGPHGLCVWPQPGRYSLGHTGILR